MNFPVRATLFQFNKNSCVKKESKSPAHRRFQTHLNLNKFKQISEEWPSPNVLSPVKNLAIAFTERKRKNFAVCEIQEIQFKKLASSDKKSTNKLRYLAGEQETKKLNIWVNEKGTGLLTPAYNSMKSVKRFIQEVKEKSIGSNHRLINKSLPDGFRSRRTGSYETPRVVVRNVSDVSSNCVCIQTDDII